MKKVWLRIAVMAFLVVSLVASKAPSADVPKAEKEAEEKTGDVDLMTQAYKLAEFGEKYKSPEAYIAAGAMFLKLKAVSKSELGKWEIDPVVTDEKGNKIADAKAKTEKPQLLEDMANDLFETASTLGAEQKLPGVEALIKAAKARDYTKGIGTRGAVGGPKSFTRSIAPHQTHVYSIDFDTNTVAAVGFQSNLPTRVKMFIGGYVHFEQVVRTGSYTWKPKPNTTDKFYTITVHNPNNEPAIYRLFTN